MASLTTDDVSPASRWLAPTLHAYDRSWTRKDVVAGLVTSCVVVPQAMAYATIAGLPVQVGLYTCLAPMVVYALLGGARAMSVSTTSTIAVLVATTVSGLPVADTADPDAVLEGTFTLTFLVGLCLLAMRMLRLGVLVDTISPATLTGIRLGVGLTVAATQVPALLGVLPDADAEGFLGTALDALGKVPSADAVTVTVAACSLLALLVLRRVAPQLPAPLLVVAAGILLVASTDLERSGTDGRGLELIERVPTGLPDLSLPVPGDVIALLPGAVAIAVMALLESVLVARTNRRSGEPTIDIDRELLAVGAASLAGGLSQSLPPAGGFSQSAVNLRSGARTQLASLVTSAVALLVALVLAPLLADLPRAVLAAMVLVAVLSLLDPRELGLYARLDRRELWVALVVGLLGLTGGMLLGVAVGVGLTLVLVIAGVNRPRVRALLPRAGGGWTTNPEAQATSAAPEGLAGAVVLHLQDGVYAGNARTTLDAVLAAARVVGDPERVVLECATVEDVTVPLVTMLAELDAELHGAELVVAGLPRHTRVVLRASAWFVEQERRGLVVDTVEEALVRPLT